MHLVKAIRPRSGLYVLVAITLGSTLACPRPATDTTKTEPARQPDPRSAEPDPAADEAIAKSDEESATAAGAKASLDDAKLEADVEQSTVGFAVARATVGHVGKFKEFDATLELAGGQPVGLKINVKTGSVVADRAGLTSHLLGSDFFHVAVFPTATFEAEQFTPDADAGPDAFVITGTMHLHGVGRKIDFPATLEIGSDQVIGRATLDISAKAFGIDYEGMEAELADDAVQLEIELVFPHVADP